MGDSIEINPLESVIRLFHQNQHLLLLASDTTGNYLRGYQTLKGSILNYLELKGIKGNLERLKEIKRLLTNKFGENNT